MTKCRHEEGPRHDCDYVDWRDSLVPVAEAIADAEQPEPSGGDQDEARGWRWRWDRAFHDAMGRLTREGVGR